MTRLLELRQSTGLTQEELAQKTGIPYRTYRRYEYGERFPKPEYLVALSKIYGYSTPGVLFDELINNTSC